MDTMKALGWKKTAQARMERTETSEHAISVEDFSSTDIQDSNVPSENTRLLDGSQARDEREASTSNANKPLQLSILKTIDKLPTLSAHDCCIYRVPERLRNLNEKAYTPQVVSIGPFHRGNNGLQVMEEKKLGYLKALLDRSKGRVSLDGYIEVIRESEERTRNHYDETIQMSSDEFVEMILLDAAFITEVMFMWILDAEAGPIMPLTLSDIRRDLILIENQIPFFVLDRLFNLAHPDPPFSLLQLALGFLENIFLVEDLLEFTDSDTTKVNVFRPSVSSSEVKHFTDLLRICHLPSCLRSPSDSEVDLVRISNATELQEAGMKFRRGPSYRLLDLQYNNKVLDIPPLRVSEWTESVLRNMVALEQCHYGYDTYVTDYVFFMDGLIDTAKDADLLIKSGIIRNELGDSSIVSNLFNNLTLETMILGSKFYYSGISQDLNAYCNQRWHRWKATLRRDYCSSPWIIASTTAAVILLLLTLIQTICSVISVA